MSSPIAHGSLVLLFQPFVDKRLGTPLSRPRRVVITLALFVALMAPDADIALGLCSPHGLMYYHNGFSHSTLVAPLFAIPFGLICGTIARGRWRFFTALGIVSYESHVMLDALTWGGGVQLFWPVTNQRFQMPLLLFFGAHHSKGLLHWSHLVTLLSDVTFAVLIWAWARRLRLTRQRTAGLVRSDE